MSPVDFLQRCHGRVCIELPDGRMLTGQFRTDILSPAAVSAYFFGDLYDMSIPIGLIVEITNLPQQTLAS